ncbi:MAG: hypothetical protein B7Z69_00535 [Actinobacteria bacterium 21-73-9]|nr:MAG: hypothetical protein B7Z69_00535 [Actinobacteria bacterium 21-73-9]
MSGSATNIVNVIESVTVAAAPSTLQSTAALVSLGGTTAAVNSLSLLTQASDLALIKSGAGNSTELQNNVYAFYGQGAALPLYVLELGTGGTAATLQTWINANLQTVYAFTTPAAWDTVVTIPAPATPTLGTVSGGTLSGATYYVKITYVNGIGETLPSTEASEAVPANSLLVVDSPTAQAGATGYNVYVSTTTGTETKQTPTPIAIGTNWTLPTTGLVTGGPLPTTNTTGSEFAGVLSAFSSPSSRVYFFLLSTVNTYSQYAGIKAANVSVPSPTAASTEAPHVAEMYQFVSNAPSAVSPMRQQDFRFAYGVTAWPLLNNQTTLTELLTANVNVILTGAEGGISNTILRNGTMMDGNDASVWWEALLAVEQQVVTNGVAWGVINPNLPITLTAIPFVTYATANPGDYSKGIYNGLALTCTPMRGFREITFNLTVQL